MIKHCLDNLNLTQNTKYCCKSILQGAAEQTFIVAAKWHLWQVLFVLGDLETMGPCVWLVTRAVTSSECHSHWSRALRDWECYRPHSVHNSSRSTSDMRTPEPEPEPGPTSQLCHLVKCVSGVPLRLDRVISRGMDYWIFHSGKSFYTFIWQLLRIYSRLQKYTNAQC